MSLGFKSIRWRLQAWYGLVLLVILVAFGFTAFYLARENRWRRIDQGLEQRLSILMDSLRPGPGRERRGGPGRPGPRQGAGPRWLEEPPAPMLEGPPAPDQLQLNPEQAARFATGSQESFYYAAWLASGQLLQKSDGAPDDLPMPQTQRAGPVRRARTRGQYRELTLANRRGIRLVVGRSVTNDLSDLRRLAGFLVLAGGGVWVLGMAGGWWVASRAIAPIDSISATAHRMTAGNLDERISVANTDSELGQLAQVLNATFDRLQAAFVRQAQFTADASHELRTPVAVVLSQTQTALSRERSPAECRETLEACRRAAQRMRRLIESLLVLARLDSHDSPSQFERCDVAALSKEVVELLKPMAAEREVCLSSEAAEALCVGDAHQLTQVLSNLVENAISYTPPGGHVRVSVRAENDWILMVVQDDGTGIAPEDLPHIFDRFYRTDRARARAQGHTGLGLAIAKAIVERHGGKLAVVSERGSGSVFTVRLPAGAHAGASP